MQEKKALMLPLDDYDLILHQFGLFLVRVSMWMALARRIQMLAANDRQMLPRQAA
jgi:hypothetical protein